MNKKELIKRVASYCDANILLTNQIIEASFDLISKQLSTGEDVEIRGFGKFFTKTLAERKGRNFHTGASLMLPSVETIKFKPSKNMKDVVNVVAEDNNAE